MLTCAVERDLSITVLKIEGALRLQSVAKVRSALMKCLVECPSAVVVDLCAVTIESPVTLALFGAVTRRGAEWPRVPLVLFAEAPELRASIERACFPWSIPVCATEADARQVAATGRPGTCRVQETLRPGTMAVDSARRLVVDACQAWQLSELAFPAGLIVTELVGNAVRHARTDLVASAMFRRGLLHLTVADGSPTPPRVSPEMPPRTTPGGRGLLLVQEFSTAWGYLPTDGGKVVWATVRP